MKNTTITVPFLVALLLPFTLVLGGGFWGGTTQHTHRSAAEGGKISWIPTGFVGCYAGSTPPVNTLEGYGQAVSRTTYAGLFSELGTTYGAGDGVSTFNLPDLRGRMIIGLDNLGGTSANRVTAAAADTLGGTGGSEIISIAQMPAHTHPGTATGLGSDEAGAQGALGIHQTGSTANGNAAFSINSFAAASQGGGAAYNPPFIALKCVIGT